MLLKAVAVAKLSVDLKIWVISSVGSAGNELADMPEWSKFWLGTEFADMAVLSKAWVDMTDEEVSVLRSSRCNLESNTPVSVTTTGQLKCRSMF